MPEVRARNTHAEAVAVLGGREARVLEPAPPAVTVGPWFADDPVGDTDVNGESVTPLIGGPASWEHAAAASPDVASFARDHWLANLKRLREPPASLPATRESLRVLAFHVLSPVRHADNGKIGLRWTKGGFGTPFFGDDRQIRVEGNLLVVQEGDHVVAEPLTTLRRAGALVGVEPGPPSGIDFRDPPPLVDPDLPLTVDADAVAFLDDWFGFSTLVLERVRAEAGSPPDTRVQLWPEHFDLAIELGDADQDSRASYGASPGDDEVAEPYLYVSPWTTRQGEFWNAPFGGAALTLGGLLDVADQLDTAEEFFARGSRLLR